MNIKELINRGEGKTLEFKKELPPGNALAKTIIAFTNMSGGIIIIGIEDKTNRMTGISEQDVLDLPDKIANIIHETCIPAIIPDISIQTIENKHLLIIRIYPGPLKPYRLKNVNRDKGVYIRVGATNKVADREMIQELERQRRNISFDEEIDYDKDISYLNIEQLKRDFKKLAHHNLNENDLLSLKLIQKERDGLYPTYGGLLLCSREIHFEYARIKCARFKGSDMSEFIDQKEFSGALYIQVEDAMKFAKTHIALSGKIDFIQRKDTYEIPLEAVREAIINAVVHRDYSISGADIKFAIFDDRIEITSPGTLPKSLDIIEILDGRSEIRNRVIARFFKEIGFIEQWGTGIRKIIDSCNLFTGKSPDFKESGLFFKVILYKPDKDFTQPQLYGLGDKLGERLGEKLGETQLKIIDLINKNSSITAKELSLQLGCSTTTIDKHIAKLKEWGIIERKGSARKGYWVIHFKET